MSEHSPLAEFFLELARLDGWYITSGGFIRRDCEGQACQCPVTAVGHPAAGGTQIYNNTLPWLPAGSRDLIADAADIGGAKLQRERQAIRHMRAALVAVCRVRHDW
jgi:hypothetical protein